MNYVTHSSMIKYSQRKINKTFLDHLSLWKHMPTLELTDGFTVLNFF